MFEYSFLVYCNDNNNNDNNDDSSSRKKLQKKNISKRELTDSFKVQVQLLNFLIIFF